MTYPPAWTRRPQPRHAKPREYLFSSEVERGHALSRIPMKVRVWDATTDQELPGSTVTPGEDWNYRTTAPSIYIEVADSGSRFLFTEGLEVTEP